MGLLVEIGQGKDEGKVLSKLGSDAGTKLGR